MRVEYYTKNMENAQQTNAAPDKRQFTRVPFVTQVTLIQDNQLWLGHVVDISFKGILVCNSFPLNFDSKRPVVAEIGFDNGATLTVKSLLAHSSGKLYGFKFLEMDADGMKLLRNIIMINLANDTACERELIALFSYHQ